MVRLLHAPPNLMTDPIKKEIKQWSEKTRHGSPEERGVEWTHADLSCEYDLGFQDGLRHFAQHLDMLGIMNYYPWVRDSNYHVESNQKYKHTHPKKDEDDPSKVD
jgi:hypothetical protein